MAPPDPFGGQRPDVGEDALLGGALQELLVSHLHRGEHRALAAFNEFLDQAQGVVVIAVNLDDCHGGSLLGARGANLLQRHRPDDHLVTELLDELREGGQFLLVLIGQQDSDVAIL
jgi:hypothetical protein